MPFDSRAVRVAAGLLAALSWGWIPGVGSAQPLTADQLQAELTALLAEHPAAVRSTIALQVWDVSSATMLFDRDSARLLTPASNLKIYTTACALDKFSPAHTFPTRLVAAGPLVDGVLHGNLVLVGGGNAMLTSGELQALLDRAVDAWGLREVQGAVVVDNSRYGSPLKGPGWMWDDDPDYYNMSVTPLMVDFNVLTVRIQAKSAAAPGDEPPDEPHCEPHCELVPPAAYPPIEVTRTPGAALKVGRRPFEHAIDVVYDSLPAEPVEARLTMHDPGLWVASVATTHLESRGVRFADAPEEVVERVSPDMSPGGAEVKGPGVKGYAVNGHEAKRDEARGTATGAAARELVAEGANLVTALGHFNEFSENAVGEVLLHELAIAAGSVQPRWADGAGVISTWLVETAGLEPGSFRLVDGSGLSRYNLVSADSSVRLLNFMVHHRHGSLFYEALPRYRVDLAGLTWPEELPADEQRIAAKPGGMASVSTISGYADTLDGRRLAFSLLANGFAGSNREVVDLRGKVWGILVRYRR